MINLPWFHQANACKAHNASIALVFKILSTECLITACSKIRVILAQVGWGLAFRLTYKISTPSSVSRGLKRPQKHSSDDSVVEVWRTGQFVSSRLSQKNRDAPGKHKASVAEEDACG